MIGWLQRIWSSPAESTGRRGERAAARWLKQRGYRILHRNLKVHDDEADIIAIAPDGLTIVVVEVKTRVSATTAPESALTSTKQFRLSRLASRLCRMHEFRDRPLRFDVIAVTLPQHGDPLIRHTPGAFESRW